MKPETMLLGIIPDNTESFTRTIYIYVNSSKNNFRNKMETEGSTHEEWKDKLDEYVVMAKLMSYINKRPIKDFQESWKAYYSYFK